MLNKHKQVCCFVFSVSESVHLSLLVLRNTGIFEELILVDAHDQLIVSFLDSPALVYAKAALSKLKCHELKFYRTNPKIPIDFFANVSSIDHLIIDNPSFAGFLPSSQTFTFQLRKLSIRDISVRHLQGKHFPILFPTVTELVLENFHVTGGFRSFSNQDLAERFPQLRSLKIFSRSIQYIIGRMFEHLNQLEYLKLNGITTIENDGFYNLHRLKELHPGQQIRRVDPYAFLHMTTELLLFNESLSFQLNDDEHFCAFAQFSPVANLKSFVQFPLAAQSCSCTIRYLYRHLDKSMMFMTPTCYANASLYILAQEERLCSFEQRLLQCHVLPDDGITIYGKHYNVSHFYKQQRSRQREHWQLLYRYRMHLLAALVTVMLVLCLTVCLIRQRKREDGSAYRHLNRLLRRRPVSSNDHVTMDIIYHRTNGHPDLLPSSIPTSTKV